MSSPRSLVESPRLSSASRTTAGATELLAELGVEPANLSQQLALLRRAGLVTARKERSSAYYSLTSRRVSELLAVARSILSGWVIQT